MIKFEGSVIELHPKELSLIIALRDKFSNGEVIINVQNGVPIRIKRVTEFDYLED